MNSYIKALRAVAGVYAKRTIVLAGWIGLGVFIALIVVTWLLAYYYSSYWWLSLIFILPIGLIGGVIFSVSFSVANIVQGALTKSQHKRVKAYVNKLQSVIEATQLSGPFILFIIAKDLLLHRNLQTLETIIGDSASLKRDIDALAAEL